MPCSLTPGYLAAMAAPVRRPLLQVTCYPDGEAREITPDVVSWSTERVLAHQAGKATLTVANPAGCYNGWLQPGTRVTVRQGLRTEAGDDLVPIFTGEVETTEARYARGYPEVLLVRLLDGAGRAFRTEITTPLYEDCPVNALLETLFTSYGGLSPAGIALDPVEWRIPRAQFVEESLMDAGAMLAQAAQRRLYFDEEGLLRTAPLALPEAPAWMLTDPAQIISVTEARQPPPATAVLVTGCLHPPTRQAGDAVVWEEVTVTGYDGALMLEVPFSPAGAVYEEISLEVVTPLLPVEQVALYAVTGSGITVKIISPGARALTFRCHGRQVYYTTPYVTAVASDTALAARFGEARVEISNPVLADDAGAALLAADHLARARWAQHSVTLRLLAHPGIVPGDLVSFCHPRTGRALSLLVTGVAHAGRRGEEATTVQALVVA